jgi:hypothetical protein
VHCRAYIYFRGAVGADGVKGSEGLQARDGDERLGMYCTPHLWTGGWWGRESVRMQEDGRRASERGNRTGIVAVQQRDDAQ